MTNLVPLYRLRNEATGDVILTTDENEQNQLGQNGYTDLGALVKVFQADLPADDPFHRELVKLYRLKHSNGTHLYTVCNVKRHRAVAEQGYTEEPVAALVWAWAPEASFTAVTRASQEATGRYMFHRAGAAESNITIEHGWQHEGMVFFGVQPDNTESIEPKPVETRHASFYDPVYRMREPNTGLRRLVRSGSYGPRSDFLAQGYIDEGVVGKALPYKDLQREITRLIAYTSTNAADVVYSCDAFDWTTQHSQTVVQESDFAVFPPGRSQIPAYVVAVYPSPGHHCPGAHPSRLLQAARPSFPFGRRQADHAPRPVATIGNSSRGHERQPQLRRQ